MPDSPPTLVLLGGVALRGLAHGDADHLLSQSKAVALLALLALAPGESLQRRDRLVGLLWPELDQQHARNSLRKVLHVTRTILGEDAIESHGDEELALNPRALACDAAEFRAAIEGGRLARAVDLFRGELMPGFHLAGCHDFDTWLEAQREAILEDAVAACSALAKHLESGDYRTEAARFARKAARLAWSNELVLRRSLLMLDRLGDRAGALQLYDEFARRLRKELEAEPSPETVRLAESLRSGRPPS